MKICLMNGSPKKTVSNSECILEELTNFLGQEEGVTNHYLNKKEIEADIIKELSQCDAIVFAFPLYVDGIPSHLLTCLKEMELFFASHNRKNVKIYAIVNCGFYESKQNAIAIDMIRNWCERAGLDWGQGLAVGAGGMLGAIKSIPAGYGPKKEYGKALQELSTNIQSLKSGETIFVNMNIPRIVYKLAAEMGWRKMVKSNGLKKRDINRRI